MKNRIVGHLDMDAFFASVHERELPALRGLPIAVGADPQGGLGRGVVSTANYPARAYGIRSATPIREAWRLSEEARKHGKPAVIFISPNFRKYEQASKIVNRILSEESTVVDPAGIDESYFGLDDLTWLEAKRVALRIKSRIKRELGLTATIGLGPNKLVAKIASDFQKPDGLTIVKPSEALDFLAGLPVKKIPGIGPKTEALFLKHKIRTIAEARKFSVAELTKIFGKTGREFYRKFLGEDDRPVSDIVEIAKSVGEQETFADDLTADKKIFKLLEMVAARVFKRFTRAGFKTFKMVAVTVRFADFETKIRSLTSKDELRTERELQRQALKLFLPFIDRRENSGAKKIRLIGVRVEKLK